jgi:hypothetical protein
MKEVTDVMGSLIVGLYGNRWTEREWENGKIEFGQRCKENLCQNISVISVASNRWENKFA